MGKIAEQLIVGSDNCLASLCIHVEVLDPEEHPSTRELAVFSYFSTNDLCNIQQVFLDMLTRMDEMAADKGVVILWHTLGASEEWS